MSLSSTNAVAAVVTVMSMRSMRSMRWGLFCRNERISESQCSPSQMSFKEYLCSNAKPDVVKIHISCPGDRGRGCGHNVLCVLCVVNV